MADDIRSMLVACGLWHKTDRHKTGVTSTRSRYSACFSASAKVTQGVTVLVLLHRTGTVVAVLQQTPPGCDEYGTVPYRTRSARAGQTRRE